MKPFSCCIIGEDTLLIECGEILLKKGHTICGIASPNLSIRQWATNHHISCYETISELQQSFQSFQFDYLFSIANGKILKEDMLRAPTKFAINYHYSLLPRYAGTYATSWAILNGEKTHGITWHVMTEEIDGGDIIEQAQFPIDKKETALTLNLKCYEYAVQNFIKLVDKLDKGDFTRIKQDHGLRNYSLLNKRPPYNGVILWNKPAEEIDRLCRALTFGNYLNQLTVPKLLIDDNVYNVHELRILRNDSNEKPGTVIRLYKDEFHVSTVTKDVAISKISSADGFSFNFLPFYKKHKIRTGYKIATIKHTYLLQLENLARNYARYENFWIEKLVNTLPGKEAFYYSSKNSINLRKISRAEIPMSIFKIMSKDRGSEEIQYFLINIFLIYLYRLNNCNNFTIKLSLPEFRHKTLNFEKFFANHLPLTTFFRPDMNFQGAFDVLLSEIGLYKKNQTYARDVKVRYPQLSHCLDLNLISIELGGEVQKHPLEPSPFSIVIAEDGTSFDLYIDEDLYSIDYLKVLFKSTPLHIQALIENVIEKPQQMISEIQFLKLPEKQQILVDWNNTETTDVSNQTVIDLFEEQVKKIPNRIAVTVQDQDISYLELNQRANQLAHYLKEFIAQPSPLIAICTERSLEMLVSILAVLKVGGAYIPLDPSYPKERLSFMLENSNAPFLLLSHSYLKYNLKNYKGEIIDLESSKSLISNACSDNLNIISDLNSLAYVLYTSGTTGMPKGVAVNHHSLVNHMSWMNPKFNFNENDIFLQKTPFSFDASIWEFFAPLLCGGKLVIDTELDPNNFCQLIQRHEVTVLQLVPSMLRQLLEGNELQNCSSLRQVFAGGEALLPDLVKIFFAKVKAKLHNLYGPTEATIQCITYSYENKDNNQQQGAIIGKPINNAKAYVLDKFLNLVPIGSAGELHIGGMCLARGYLNREDLTAERFIKNPFVDSLNSRIYKTGDIVRWLPDGNMQYIGRIDDQIKLNGLRIELGEIEATLMRHKAIQACSVIIQEMKDVNGHLTGNKCLLAFYVKKLNILPSDINEYVRLWETIYQSKYSSLNINNYMQNTEGRISSYTGQMIEAEQLVEWVNNSIERIKLLKPRVVLEIGSGSGLVLFNLIKDCNYYYATDFSENVIHYTDKVIEKHVHSDKVRTYVCSADKIPYNELDKPYDTVLINSVIQYFPNTEYLEKVIKEAIDNIKESGQIFIGDVRDFRLLECFHYSIISYKKEKLTKGKVDYFALRDKELLVSPSYFVNLEEANDKISYVEILPKLGTANNEMNNYRYDVILHINKLKTKEKILRIDESEFVRTHDFKNFVDSHQSKEFICIKYPNNRIIQNYIKCEKLYGNNLKININELSDILDMHFIMNLATSKNMIAKFFIDIHDPLYLNIVLLNRESYLVENVIVNYTYRAHPFELSSKPLENLKLLDNQFSYELKDFLSSKLPSYMVPTRYVPLDKMPLNINGKLDRVALEENGFIESENYIAPRNEIETLLCQIWGRVLGLPEGRVGIKDDFFNLGGYSLSALKAIALVNDTFQVKLRTATLFTEPTIEQLANEIIKEQNSKNEDRDPIISPVIPLQRGGKRTPLFLVHPLGGTIFWYRDLSKYLGVYRPIYGIEDPSINLNKIIFENVPEMASYYLKSIKKIQPIGPYMIGGASFGGTLAIEIANQILNLGEEVEFLGLMDVWPHYNEKFWERGFLEQMMLRECYNVESKPIKQSLSNMSFLLSLYHQRSLMFKHYKVPVVDCRILFFKAKELWSFFEKINLSENGWWPYSTQTVEDFVVPGDHESMFNEPNVQELAKIMNQKLNAIEEQKQIERREVLIQVN